MRLGREPSFKETFHCGISVVRDLPHLKISSFFSKGKSRHMIKTHTMQFICCFIRLIERRLQALPYRSNLYLQNCRLLIGLWCASIKIHEELQRRSGGEFKTQQRISLSVSPQLSGQNYVVDAAAIFFLDEVFGQ